jgi:sRNA-binding carbon storage regulator CsrA
MRNPKLSEAVDIFKALGWEGVTLDNVLDLPLGTPEQKRTALAGLKSGEWGEFTKLNETTYGWRSFVEVDEGKLGLFAVRIGVDARKAVNVLRGSKELLVTVIAERGEKFASDFIQYACVSSRRTWEHSASAFGGVAVLLVDRLGLDIPQTAEYMKDWSVYAAAAMGLKAETFYGETDLPGLGLIEKRFVEHIQTGVAVGAPATGPFCAVFPEGVKRGWLAREQAADLAFFALDAAVRPGDRKVWLRVLDELGVTDAELCARLQSLIPLLATGDTAVITRLAPTLIASAENGLLTETLLAAFSATANKARQLVLKSAMSRPRPDNAEDVTAWLALLSNDKDKTVSRLAGQLMEQWSISVDALPEETAEIQGLWRETPEVWHMPPFEIGEVSPEVLTALAAQLVGRAAVVHDVTTERFLAVANAAARQDPEAARMSLRGLRHEDTLLYFAKCWAKKEEPGYGFDKNGENNNLQALTRYALMARDYVVFLNLGKLPCLLSIPSNVDLTVSIPDITARLLNYQKDGVGALEADLFLALTRLDVTTATEEAWRKLEKLDVPVLLQSGEKMPVTAGEIVRAYLNDPIKEPPLSLSKSGYWGSARIHVPESLRVFPLRLDTHSPERFSVFPCFGYVAQYDVKWNSGEVYHEKGLILRQVARRKEPLSPGVAMNLLAAQRSSDPDAAEDSLLAVTEAWERGLLRPGVADVKLLDWSSKPPSNLAALAVALNGIAQDGLLAVVWPLLDALIAASLDAPRLLAGTAELAEYAAALLPEVIAAVEQGKAEKSALYVPGLRALAERGGSSRAVLAARKALDTLPPMEVPAVAEKPAAPLMDPSFDKVWPTSTKEVVLIDDDVTITVDVAYSGTSKKLLLFTLALPGISDRVFQVAKNWHYDLEHEGQCQAYAVVPGTVDVINNKEKQVWLHWDEKKNAMAVCEHRNWVDGKDGFLPGMPRPPLPLSLLTVIIGLLAQDNDAVYFAPRMLGQFIKKGQIDARVVRRAAQTLLQSPAVSPAKLTRALEKEIGLLPVLWPLLTESVKMAGGWVETVGKPPVWVNRILDIILRYAPYLVEAGRRGLVPAEDARWVGLSKIASSTAKSAAVTKAQNLLWLPDA